MPRKGFPKVRTGCLTCNTSLVLVKAGQAILQSPLLSPAQTGRWFAPRIQTGYLSTAVGAPWEIRYLNFPQGLVPCVTKEGDVGSYHAALAFSPNYDLGWVVLTGGTPDSAAADVRTELFNAFGDVFLPAAELQARKEAIETFNGTYVDEISNSSATILVGTDGRPGLQILNLVSHGVEIVGNHSSLIKIFGHGKTGRLYPSKLKTVSRQSDGTTYESRLGFRATFFDELETGKIEDPCLWAWIALGAPLYGQNALDDWVFEMGEDRKATTLDVRMLRLKLKRT